MIKICVITLLFTCFLMIIRSVKGEIALPLSMCVSVLIAGASLAALIPLIDFLRTLEEKVDGSYLTVMLKALGIALITSTSSELCRDNGENAIASKIDLLGKCEILLLCLPILKSIIETVNEVLDI